MKTIQDIFKLHPFLFVYYVFLLILSSTTTILGYFFPEIVFANVHTHEASPVLYFYAARNAGIFIAFFLGLVLRDNKIYLTLFSMRFVVEALDLLATIKFNLVEISDLQVIASWCIFFIIPELLAIVYLLRQVVDETKH